jgi:hypothetical protein
MDSQPFIGYCNKHIRGDEKEEASGQPEWVNNKEQYVSDDCIRFGR